MFIQNAYASSEGNTSGNVSISQTSENLPEAPSKIQSSLTSIVPMVLIFIVFYFFLIRPQEKKRKAQAEMVSGVKKGEEVLTNSGIFGVVTKINDSNNTVELEVGKDTQIKILKSSIVDIVSRRVEKSEKSSVK